jgi:hypothetical protein
MPSKRGPKPRITYDGKTYTARRWSVDIPDLDSMDRLSALAWLVANTTPTGYSRPKPNLSGINLVVR